MTAIALPRSSKSLSRHVLGVRTVTATACLVAFVLLCLVLAHPSSGGRRFTPRPALTPPPVMRQIPIVPGPVRP